MVFDPSKSRSANGDIPDDAPGGKYGYRLGHQKGDYEIPDVILNSPHRKIKVITIGAGISGIFMSYLIQKFGNNIEHVVYEKNGDIGGTWLEVLLIFNSSYPSGFSLTKCLAEPVSWLCMRRAIACLRLRFRPQLRLAQVPEPKRRHLSLPRPSGGMFWPSQVHVLQLDHFRLQMGRVPRKMACPDPRLENRCHPGGRGRHCHRCQWNLERVEIS